MKTRLSEEIGNSLRSSEGTERLNASTRRAPVEIFCCYCHRDEEFRMELDVHLHGLEREGLISIWQDRRIGTGIGWNRKLAYTWGRRVSDFRLRSRP